MDGVTKSSVSDVNIMLKSNIKAITKLKQMHMKQRFHHDREKNRFSKYLNRGNIPYSYSDTRRVTLVTSPLIRNEWVKDREVFITSRTYSWSFVIHIFHIGQPSHGVIA